jgi:hypothetical protein
MSAAKHTPGPWSVACWVGAVKGATEQHGLHESVWAGDLLICPTGLVTDPEALPNARLIAAAPLLLDALQTIVEQGTTYPPHWESFSDAEKTEFRKAFPPTQTKAAKIAAAAIAAATGVTR